MNCFMFKGGSKYDVHVCGLNYHVSMYDDDELQVVLTGIANRVEMGINVHPSMNLMNTNPTLNKNVVQNSNNNRHEIDKKHQQQKQQQQQQQNEILKNNILDNENQNNNQKVDKDTRQSDIKNSNRSSMIEATLIKSASKTSSSSILITPLSYCMGYKVKLYKGPLVLHFIKEGRFTSGE